MSEATKSGDLTLGSIEILSNIISEKEVLIDNQNEEQIQNTHEKCEKALKEEKLKAIALQKDLQVCTEERDHYKNLAANFEKELIKNSLKGKKGNSQDDSSDLVTQASSVIFEKTKVCKNQELQIEALSQQVKSLKDIVSITKDMLEIRNMEIQQLHDKLECMEVKFAAEKNRQEFMHVKLDKMMTLNADLKSEYQKQLALFMELQTNKQPKQNGMQ